MIDAVLDVRAAVPDAYVETLHVTGPDGAFDATAHVLGSDYKIDVVLDGVTYSYGRVSGRSWRQTPNGVVRIVRSDVQSDALDRWPRSRFGFTPEACATAGTTVVDQRSLWVLRCDSAGDIPHWFDIDPQSGRILHEIARDGSHVFTYDFADARHWTIHGYGGDAHVTVESLVPTPVTPADVAIPPTARSIFDLPASGVAEIPARFGFHIGTPVTIDGVGRTFIIDTGTTQILIDIGEAARLGLHPVFGHVIIPELRVGGVVARDVAAQAVNIFHDQTEGILGYEFFSGHIVHIDYKKQTVELISHERFSPPKGARALPFDPREGMPIVQGGENGIRGDRFAIDTGSRFILLSSGFAQRVGAENDPVLYCSYCAGVSDFLEGPMYTVLRQMPSFDIGPYRVVEPIAAVEEAQPENVDFPLDGIIGEDFLSSFDWWFDYDDGIAWVR